MNYLEQSRTILKICTEIQDFLWDNDVTYYSQWKYVFNNLHEIDDKTILDSKNRINVGFIESCSNKYDMLAEYYEDLNSEYYEDEDDRYIRLKKEIPNVFTNSTLKIIISISLLLWGKEANLNFINVEGVKDFSSLFYYHPENNFDFENSFPIQVLPIILKYSQISKQEQDELMEIESNVYNKTEHGTYFYIKRNLFNGFINEWKTKKGINFDMMFNNSYFNQHELCLDLRKAKDCYSMFSYSKLDKKLAIKGKIKEASKMFFNANIRQKIEIDLSQCKDMFKMFYCEKEHLEKEGLKNFSLEQLSDVNFGLIRTRKFRKDEFLDLYKFIPDNVFKKSLEEQEPSNLKTFLGTLDPVDVMFGLGLEVGKMEVTAFLDSNEALSLCYHNLDHIPNYYNYSFSNPKVKEEFLYLFSKSLKNLFVLLELNHKNDNNNTLIYLDFLKANVNKEVFYAFIEENKDFLNKNHLIQSYYDKMIIENNFSI